MRASSGEWARRLAWPAGAALGLAAEAGAVRTGDALADLATGWCVLACGLVLWRRRRRPGMLLAATGATWFAGNFASWALFAHRGPLVHLLLAWPGARAGSPALGGAIAVGYAAALIEPIWRSEPAALALSAALAAASLRRRDVARPAGLALALVLAAGAAARLAFPEGDADRPALLAYEVVVAGVALALAAAGRRPLTDLVVELGERRPAPLHAALAQALGDPALEDPRVAEAVAAAERLAAANERLQAEVRAQVAELEASRRRLVAAGDDERRRLELRLRAGAGRRLDRLGEALARAGTGATGEAAARIARARDVLVRTRADLEELARGLHPGHLSAAGLGGAVAELTRGGAVPVTVSVPPERLDPGVEAVAYYVCAEGLANVTKYAAATRVEITVARRDGTVVVEVADDGAGGANPERGSGLRGLRDRLEAQGGRLEIESPPGGGTRLTARIPG